ncbi:MAG: MinD/ParA family protein [Desulforegulaceae bacterium]|nr:MinD/ParA family protein [Desulforegulaceae bacterium]
MKIITITSGKGGVGKTIIAVNLAISLAKKGYKTCLFDADTGLANVNILMGIIGNYTLEDVISGSKPLKDIIIKDWNNIDIIPGSSGVEQFETLEKKELENIITQFSNMNEYDYIIVDTGAGISKAVVSFCLASSILIVAIVPEPSSLTDSYSLLKVLKFNGFNSRVNIISNKAESETLGEKTFQKFKNTVLKYIDLNLSFLGSIPEDKSVTKAVSMQLPFIINFPDSPSSKKILKIADIIINSGNENISQSEETSFDSFIKSCSNFFQSGLELIRPKEEIPELENEEYKTENLNKNEKKAVLEKIDLLIQKNNSMIYELEELKKMILKK